MSTCEAKKIIFLIFNIRNTFNIGEVADVNFENAKKKYKEKFKDAPEWNDFLGHSINEIAEIVAKALNKKVEWK